MKGYKVVNYDLWESLPDIFNSIDEAKKARKKWKNGKGAIIEQFNSKFGSVKHRWFK